MLTGGAIVAVMLFPSGPLVRPGQPRQFQPSPDATLVPDAGRPLA